MKGMNESKFLFFFLYLLELLNLKIEGKVCNIAIDFKMLEGEDCGQSVVFKTKRPHRRNS